MTLPWNGPACPRCALPAAPAPCPGCAGAPAALWRSIAAFRYAEPVSDWIHAFKFHRRLADGRLLGTLLGRVAARDLEARPPGLAPQAIVPIPLHRRRLRSRGFDQNRELLRAVVRATPGVPVLHALQRVRDTAHQARLNLRERRGNLNEAFSVRRRALDRLPAHIAVFDDVVTTGATLSAACAPLQAAGVERIECWTVARTPG